MQPLVVWIPPEAQAEHAFVEALRVRLPAGVGLEVGARAPETQVLVCGVPTTSMLAACPRLERVIVPYAGVPRRTLEVLAARPELALHNLHHNAPAAAELAVGLLLASVKGIVPHDRELRAGVWHGRHAQARAPTLAGRHALVLGYGAIGQRVARALLGLAMRVSAVRRGAADGDRHGMVALAPPSALDALLPEADAVLVCLPLTSETEDLLDARRLALLRPGAHLVNVGRGRIVNEFALYGALAEGRMAGAGLDVWYRYPAKESERGATLPASMPFHELENVVLSPHRAGRTVDSEEMRAAALARLLRAAVEGQPVPQRVDLARGY
ncbi:MAG: NAD(P)-dependent oxidoreductase [Planctomycetota bacterium]|nr:NAD(P)-dependent oxidoreductase [Planctomycetota bacterium]